jgi:hypothetical protein
VSNSVRFEQIAKPQLKLPYASVRLQLEPQIDGEYQQVDEGDDNLKALARRRSERTVRMLNLQQRGRHSVWQFDSEARAHGSVDSQKGRIYPQDEESLRSKSIMNNSFMPTKNNLAMSHKYRPKLKPWAHGK